MFDDEKFFAMMAVFEDAVHDRDSNAVVGVHRAPTGHLVVTVVSGEHREAYFVDTNTMTWLVTYGVW